MIIIIWYFGNMHTWINIRIHIHYLFFYGNDKTIHQFMCYPPWNDHFIFWYFNAIHLLMYPTKKKVVDGIFSPIILSGWAIGDNFNNFCSSIGNLDVVSFLTLFNICLIPTLGFKFLKHSLFVCKCYIVYFVSLWHLFFFHYQKLVIKN